LAKEAMNDQNSSATPFNPFTLMLDSKEVQRRIRLVHGKEYLFDKDDFLWQAKDWTEELAEVLAADCGIEKLSDDQWRLIRFLRDYYFYNGRAPLNKDLKAGLSMSVMELECLFPGGIKRTARRIAGLPNPRTCSG
jgi:dissimilatory sulfite reductase related protein